MKISVIIPVYNAEKYLKKCIESVINQTYKNWEIIAIDDESKDESYKILQEYAKKDARIIVETKANEGPGLTRNKALDKATGDYIVFLDSDDYIEKNYFQSLAREAENGSDVVFIDVVQRKPNGDVIKYEKMSAFESNNRKDIIGCQMSGYMPWGGVRKAAKRLLIEKHHLRYTADTVGEEAIFSFELLRNAEKVSFIKENLYNYINHPGSQSKAPNSTWEITLKKMAQHLESKKIKEEYKVSLNGFAFTVLISWLLRFAKRNKLKAVKKEFVKKIEEFEKDYGWEIEKKYIRKELRPLIPFVKYKALLPVIIAAKLIRR